jgi:type II secretory pathway component PulF
MMGTIGVNFTSGMIDQVVVWISNVFSDLSPLLLLIVGVGVGLIVIGAIISALRR